MADKKASTATFDFTDVKDEGSSFNKKRQPEGDYAAKVVSVADSPSKKDNVMQWLFTIEVGSGVYPYYCKHQENQLWKIRNLLIAAGIPVPKKRNKIDPNVVVGKKIAVTLEDDEYDGKAQSNISATFPLSELNSDDASDDDDEPADDDDDDEPTPAPKKKKAAPVEDDDDEDEPAAAADEEEDAGDELDGLDRAGLKAYIASKGLKEAVPVYKSDDEDALRVKIRAAEASSSSDDDDLEEIDIDDT